MGKVVGGMLAAALFLCAASWANAALVTYTFQNVVFEDGGTLSGSFTVDPALVYGPGSTGGTGTFVNFDIKTAGGSSGMPPHEYKSGGVGIEQPMDFTILDAEDVDGSGVKHFLTLALLSDNGQPSGLIGTVPIVPRSTALFSYEMTQDLATLQGSSRLVVSGNAFATLVVPEPATYGLMLAGLALVAGIATRKRLKN